MLGHVGLLRPYRFERAIIVLLAILLAAVAGLSALWLASIGELVSGGPRAGYFLYVGALLFLVVAAVRWPRLAIALLLLAFFDVAGGVGAFALHRAGLAGYSLLPPAVAEPVRFRWHALLQAVPIANLKIVSPTGLAIEHTSEGTRGREPDPRSIYDRTVIALFGGSTTYDIGVGEGDTWSDRLAAELAQGQDRERYFIVNHGVPGYTTVEHTIQTAFYQDRFGRPPRCAVYYVGWNDLRNAHIPDLDPGFADFHLPSQVDSLKVRRLGGSNVTLSPMLTLLARLVAAESDTVRYSTDPYALPMTTGPDANLAALYERNIRTISEINRGRGVATIWVGQLVNRDRLVGDGRYGWLPRVADRDVWPLLQQFNGILEQTAGSLGDTHLAIPPETFKDVDFVDNGHFSAAGARRFAELLAPVVREACR